MKITNKFIKFLIIVNGLMLPVLVGFGIFQVSKELFPNRKKFPDGIILGEELKEAKKDSVTLQGLKYYSPRDLYNSKNTYLPISFSNCFMLEYGLYSLNSCAILSQYNPAQFTNSFASMDVLL